MALDKHCDSKYSSTPSGVLQRPYLSEPGLFWHQKVEQRSIGKVLLCVHWRMKAVNIVACAASAAAAEV